MNTSSLEYAVCLSEDLLELYFTRADPQPDPSVPRLYVSVRSSVLEPFGSPVLIAAAEGFVEAATLSPDGRLLYYHKLEDKRFVLYVIEKIDIQ